MQILQTAVNEPLTQEIAAMQFQLYTLSVWNGSANSKNCGPT